MRLSNLESTLMRVLYVYLLMTCVGRMCPVAAAWDAADPVRIENELLQVRFDTERGSFSLCDKSSGAVYLADGRLTGSDGSVSVVSCTDTTFGAGDTKATYRPFPLIRACGVAPLICPPDSESEARVVV